MNGCILSTNIFKVFKFTIRIFNYLYNNLKTKCFQFFFKRRCLRINFSKEIVITLIAELVKKWHVRSQNQLKKLALEYQEQTMCNSLLSSAISADPIFHRSYFTRNCIIDDVRNKFAIPRRKLPMPAVYPNLVWTPRFDDVLFIASTSIILLSSVEVTTIVIFLI